MAKIKIKYEKLTPFREIYFTSKSFNALVFLLRFYKQLIFAANAFAKWPISGCETGRFIMRNGPFCVAIRPISQHVHSVLFINIIQTQSRYCIFRLARMACAPSSVAVTHVLIWRCAC